jgi:ubiquinone/menaquinone biosynthesis C-methylase UbiE
METQTSIPYSGSIPKIYDEILGPAYFEPYAIETANRVAALMPKNILEIAAGTGRVTNHLQKNLPESCISATDISDDMLAIAKAKMEGAENIGWLVADAMALPFRDNEFDVVVCQFGAMFFPDKSKGFSEVNRVLKKNGIFFLVTWDKLSLNPIAGPGREQLTEFFEGNPPAQLRAAFSMTDKDEMKSLLEQSGFTNIKIESINKPCIAESAEQLAYANIDGSIVLKFVKEKNPDAVPVLRDKLAKTIAEKFGNHPVRSTMQAIFVTSQNLKP